MSTLPKIQRYTNLIKYQPAGEKYAATGTLIPYRSGTNDLRIETGEPSQQFGFYINEKYWGQVETDASGDTVFSVMLDMGEVEFKLVNLATGATYLNWVTVRDSALWLAAYASVIEDVDVELDRVYNSYYVLQADARDVEDMFGREIQTFNDTGLALPDYRRQLHELRHSYRHFGGKYLGTDHAVGEFTQVPPFGFARRRWGPNWVLNQSMLKNHKFANRSCEVSWRSAAIAGVTPVDAEAGAGHIVAAPHSIIHGVTGSVHWLEYAPYGASGPRMVARDGSMFLPGVTLAQRGVLGVPVTPFNVVAGTNDSVHLEVGDRGIIDIQLVTGLPTPTVAQVVSDINTALVADARYGALFSSAASVYKSARLLLWVDDISFKVVGGPNNAALAILGQQPGSLAYPRYLLDGVELGPILLSGGLGSATITLDDTASSPTVEWASPGGSVGAAVSITTSKTYSVVDSLGSTLDVYIDPSLLPSGLVTVLAFEIGYQCTALESSVLSPAACGVWLDVDLSLLPAGSVSQSLDIKDMQLGVGSVGSSSGPVAAQVAPDGWAVTVHTAALDTLIVPSTLSNSLPNEYLDSADNAVGPRSAYSWFIQDTSTDTIVVESAVHLTPHEPSRGSLSPQANTALFYDYEGFEAVFSCWVKYMYGTSATMTAIASFSWDGGSTWQAGSTVNLVADETSYALEPFDHVTVTKIIPAKAATGAEIDVRVRLEFDKSDAVGAMQVLITSPNVQIEHVSSGFLQDTTILRNRHRQYFGELMWVWSPDELSLKEKAYIGLMHKSVSRNSPFSGIEITQVSEQTSAGTGSFEYSHNPVSNVKKIRWSTFDSVWGAGVGWSTVIANGVHQVAAPDSSYLTVNIVFDLLPSYTGSSTVEKVINVGISDTTVQQGHIRKIAPAHSSIDIFDVTEYDSGGLPLNLRGAVSEGDFTACTFTNLEIQASNPQRYSYLYPTDAPVTGEAISFSSATYKAVIAKTSDQDMTTSVLYIDGEPLYNTDPATGVWAWRFTTATEVEVRAAYFTATSVYTLDYSLLYQVTVPVFDLATTYTDYAWYADYYLWDRFSANLGSFDAEVPLVFNPDTGLAYLQQASNQDYSTAKLMAYDDQGSRQLPQSDWKFEDAFTVSLKLAQFVVDTQYVLVHEESRVYHESYLNIIFEQRSGATPAACELAAWVDTAHNENVLTLGGLRYHQLRLTVQGVKYTRDFKIRSLVLKGLHLYGAGASVPGLID